MTKKLSFEDALILNTLVVFRAVVRFLPLSVSFFLARRAGDVFWFLSKRRKIAYQNLRAVFRDRFSPRQMRRIGRRSLQNLVLSGVEILRFPETDRAYVDRHVRIVNEDKIASALAAGKGVIFLTAHFGNWEFLNILSNLKGYPMIALARVQKHPRSDAYLNWLRTSKGNQVIRKGMPIREILRALREGKIVGMLSDQDSGKKGVFVEFFGRLSSYPQGVAAFSMRTGAAVFPVFIFREKNAHHRVEIEGPLRVPENAENPEEAEREILRQFAAVLESKIRKDPPSWLWVHRRWKSTPDRTVLVLNDGKAGHLHQSLAVTQALKRERLAQGAPPDRFFVKIINVRFRNKFWKEALRNAARFSRGRLPFKMFWLKNAFDRTCARELFSAYADVVVSSGSSLVAANLLMKALNASRSVVVMKPHVPAARFDAVVVPRHDNVSLQKNVFVTEGAPSGVSTEAMPAARAILEGLSLNSEKRRVGLLIGGDTEEVHFDPVLFEDILKKISALSSEAGALILATTSRRTPGWADDLVKRYFADSSACPFLVVANEKNPPGAAHAIFEASDVLVVSAESMSMLSEALSTGKPVIAFLPSMRDTRKKKHRQFVERLASKNFLEEVRGAEALARSLSSHLGGTNGTTPEKISAFREEEEAVLNRMAKAIA